jgi:alanine racemase
VFTEKLLMTVHSYNRVTINPQALSDNFRIIQEKTGPEVKVLAMVKADGYGHDMIRAAKTFAAAGCEAFGVAEVGEAVTLREAGIKGQIFIMLGLSPEHIDLVFRYNLTPVVFLMETVEGLSRAATKEGVQIGVHLKVDSGMSRLGLLPDQVGVFLERMSLLPSVYLAGIASHFSQSDNPYSDNTQRSYASYQAMCSQVREKYDGLRHIGNSDGVFNFPETCCDMVRPGISLYGYYPDGQAGADRARGERLRPAMSFTSRVLQVKTVPAGSGVSYGHTYITPSETRLAILPVGYEDGYLRSLSNRAEVLVKGKRAPVRGRICMNMCMIDITGIDGVEPGDEAVLLGAQGEDAITADEIAEWAGTISYEVLCLIGNNNERTYTSEEI